MSVELKIFVAVRDAAPVACGNDKDSIQAFDAVCVSDLPGHQRLPMEFWVASKKNISRSRIFAWIFSAVRRSGRSGIVASSQSM